MFSKVIKIGVALMETVAAINSKRISDIQSGYASDMAKHRASDEGSYVHTVYLISELCAMRFGKLVSASRRYSRGRSIARKYGIVGFPGPLSGKSYGIEDAESIWTWYAGLEIFEWITNQGLVDSCQDAMDSDMVSMMDKIYAGQE